jgi:gliding motility-associated-like protein
MLMIGINIFTYAIVGMKKFLFFIFLCFSLGLSAQLNILTDRIKGCAPLMVNFSTLPDTTVNWDFGNGEVSLDSHAYCVYKDTGTYSVICNITASINPTDADTAVIRVVECPDPDYIPNVFTPNDDGKNDFFEIPTDKTNPNSYLFSVYSRSGTLIYRSESPTVIWDGRSMSGQKMTAGIYFYTLSRVNGELLNDPKGIVYLYE